MAQKTEEELLLRRLDGKVVRAMRAYELIADGDKLLVGLSGGKDSLALVELLGRRMRIFRPKFTLVAAHVRMRNIPYESDEAYLREVCEAYGVPLIVKETEFDPSTDTRHTPCFLCSWMRRKTLFEIAKGIGCRKIALGHHQDDILETLLLNLNAAFEPYPPRIVQYYAAETPDDEVRHGDCPSALPHCRGGIGHACPASALSEAGEELSLRDCLQPDIHQTHLPRAGNHPARRAP